MKHTPADAEQVLSRRAAGDVVPTMSAEMVIDAPHVPHPQSAVVFEQPVATQAAARQSRRLIHPEADVAMGSSTEPAEPGSAARQTASQSADADGRLREDGVTDSDRNFSVVMHLSPLAFIWIGPFALAVPLIMWLVRKDESRFVNDHGREIVNFMISLCVLHVITALTIVGLLAWPVLWVVAVVGMIRGSIAAGRSEYYRYPMTIRLLT